MIFQQMHTFFNTCFCLTNLCVCAFCSHYSVFPGLYQFALKQTIMKRNLTIAKGKNSHSIKPETKLNHKLLYFFPLGTKGPGPYGTGPFGLHLGLAATTRDTAKDTAKRT